MAVEQLPGRVREFARWLDGLLTRLDQGGGWCGVFWQRDPDGMRACLDGREVPPWDVVEALLTDFAGRYGGPAAAAETDRARPLHAAALTAYDARPGARDALADRLDVMLREQRYAAERQADLTHRLTSATGPEEARALRLDLAWARDDHARAAARCAELRGRIARLEGSRARSAGPVDGAAGDVAGGRRVRGPDDWFGGRDATFRAPGTGGFGGAGAHGTVPAETTAVAPGPADAGIASLGRPRTGGFGGAGAHGTAPAGFGGAGAHGTAPAGFGGAGAHGTAPAETTPVAPGPADAGVTPVGRPGARRATPDAAGSTFSGPGAEGAGPSGDTAADVRGVSWGPGAEGAGPAGGAPADPPVSPAPDARPAPAGKPRKRRRGSARFAGAAEDDAPPAVVPPAGVAEAVTAGAGAGPAPRGARFAGAADEAEQATVRQEPGLDDRARRDVLDAVARLGLLRAEGRSGEAHALLVEAAHWPAARFPLLAAELQRAGLGADWATLLWEAASLPADRLVAAADALAAAGLGADGEQMLRQGVVRPAAEIGEAVRALAAEGRDREITALLDACVRVRTPEEAARSAAADPQLIAPLLLRAARAVSEERHWDLVHALRVAGTTG
ncbi:hypothetical protein [Streptomyces griseosporeus]|uniref:hypothetical protein n=1 Tax=Streptomyces griseosporeus TaxID=1910 RepID=UPI00167D7216|nr:hypothetical protein [Streptomyces griseosporeus]GHF45538.1 hypothetical protein GCM10018783_13350 [Streptomyces griseosporeus]